MVPLWRSGIGVQAEWNGTRQIIEGRRKRPAHAACSRGYVLCVLTDPAQQTSKCRGEFDRLTVLTTLSSFVLD